MTNGRFRLQLLLWLVGVCVTVAFSGPDPVRAHGGGLDKYGCHHNRKAGGYHCHRGPCAGKSFSTQSAMLADSCAKNR